MPIPLRTLLRLPTKFVAFLSDAKGAGMISAGAAAATATAAGTGAAAAAAPLAVPLALAAGGFFILDVCLDAHADMKSEEDSDDLKRKLKAIFANTNELMRRSPFTPAAAERIAECERGERDLAHLIAPPGDPGAAVIELYKALKRQPPGGTDATLLRDIQASLNDLEGKLEGGLPALASLVEASAEQNLVALEAAGDATLITVAENFSALGDYLTTRDAELHAKLEERFADSGLQLTRIETTTARIDETTLQTHAAVQRMERKLENPSWYPSPPDRSLTGLPLRRGALFTGRDSEIHDLVVQHFATPHGTGSPPLILCGPMGVGKTTLATELLYHLHARGTIDHAIFLPAGDASALPATVEALVAKLGLCGGDQPVPPSLARRLLADWMGGDRVAGKVLICFDNADSDDSRDAVMAEAESFPTASIVVSSRLQDWQAASVHLVAEWTPLQAAEFLTKRLPQLGVEDGQRLCADIGRLPLALELAAALISRLRLDLSALLQRWREKLAQEQIPGRKDNATVAALLAMSLDRLAEAPRQLLAILAHYAPQAIPQELVESMQHQGWRENLADLAEASLITWSAEDGTVALHPFIRMAVLQATPEAKRETWAFGALTFLNNYLPPFEWSERWEEWPLLLPHVTALWQQMKCRTYPRGTERGAILGWMLSKAGLHKGCRAAYPEADHFLSEALLIAKATFGDDNPNVSSALNNLGQLYYKLGRLGEAEPLLRDAMRIDRTVFGTEHPANTSCLNNLALLLKDTGRFEEAESHMREALRIAQTGSPSDDPAIPACLSSLATLLLETNRIEEAETMMREALRINRAALGSSDPRTAACINNLALLLNGTHRDDEAEPLMREALTIARAAYDPTHPDVITSINNLANLLRDSGRYSQAEPLFLEALEATRATYGSGHSKVATSLNSLARLFEATGRLHRAEPLMREALRVDRAALGADHPHVALQLNKLAEVLVASNRLGEAEELMREVLRIDQKAFGDDHPNIAIHLGNLGGLLYQMKRFPEAETLMREALRIDLAASGKDHPNVTRHLMNLAGLLQLTDRAKEAESMLRQVLQISRASQRGDDPEVAIALNNIAQCFRKARRFARAEPPGRRALWILAEFGRKTGHKHPKFEATKRNYADILQSLKIPAAEIPGRLLLGIDQRPPDTSASWGVV